MIQLLIFLFPLAYSPGPGNMFFAAMGARFGFRRTIPANLGYHLATWLVTLAFGLGFGWFLAEFPRFFDAMKYVGSAYVLYLAWKLMRAGTSSNEQEVNPAGFWAGVWLLVLNPKAYIIIMLLYAQFLPEAGDIEIWQVLKITTIFTLNNCIAFSIFAYGGAALTHRFAEPQYAARLNSLFGIILAIVAIWILLD